MILLIFRQTRFSLLLQVTAVIVVVVTTTLSSFIVVARWIFRKFICWWLTFSERIIHQMAITCVETCHHVFDRVICRWWSIIVLLMACWSVIHPISIFVRCFHIQCSIRTRTERWCASRWALIIILLIGTHLSFRVSIFSRQQIWWRILLVCIVFSVTVCFLSFVWLCKNIPKLNSWNIQMSTI